MPKYENEDVLRERATPFLERLRDEGFEASVWFARDNMLKIDIQRDGSDCGPVLIYYKSSVDAFSIGGHEMRDQSLFGKVEALFHESASVGDLPGYHVYVDGSCKNGGIGYGWVLYLDGNVQKETSGSVDKSPSGHQVVGELKAAVDALDWCEQNGIESVSVHYDYEGIEKFATGEWNASERLTKRYAHLMQNCPVEVTWVDEEGHAGVVGNERADDLAGQGATSAGGASGEKSAKTDRLEELRTVVDDFLQTADLGMQVSLDFKGIKDENYARIVVHRGGEKGYMHIYNTKKRHLWPLFQNIDDNLQERLEQAWKAHRRSRDRLSPKEQAAQSAKHFYEIYEPYRDENRFDFVYFARALEDALTHTERAEKELQQYRFQFDQLEEVFKSLPLDPNE
jgi:ribonuclease HI